MTGELRLEPPFYLPEAVAKFVTEVTAVTGNTAIVADALLDPRVSEALNAALRFSVENAR